MKKLLVFYMASFSLFVGCSSQINSQVSKEAKGVQSSAVLTRKVLLELNYLIYVPENYGEEQKAWPLLVFLHGAGERGDDLNKVKAHGPSKLIQEGINFPFIVVSPQCPTDKWWPNMLEHVMALIDETLDNYSVDENRIYLTGLSMGGYGTWTIASAYPQRFAAIAPICGGGQPYLAKTLKSTPIWAFHGAKDPVVPLQQSQQMVDAVNQWGGSAKLTVYPEADHDSWTRTYNNDKLYEWLLSHSNKSGSE